MGSNGPLEVLFVAKSPQNIYSSLFLLKCQQKNHTHTECRPHPGTASYLGRWSSPPLLLPQLCSRNIESLEQEYEKKEPTVCRQPALNRCLVLTIFFDPQRPAQSLLWPSPPLPLSLFPIFLGVFSFYTSAPVWLMFCSEMWRWWKTDWFKVSFSLLLLPGSYLLPLSSWVASNHIYDQLSTPGQPPPTLLAAAVNFIKIPKCICQ